MPTLIILLKRPFEKKLISVCFRISHVKCQQLNRNFQKVMPKRESCLEVCLFNKILNVKFINIIQFCIGMNGCFKLTPESQYNTSP